jgi:CRISPR/Cas system type I-B associated protein Csh2 (Cas7 group RAMP superfamily)
MNRATGLLVIEVINSNPNGNPDQESDPRQRPDERGMISPVSFKRKLRDLVEDKNGPAWTQIGGSFDPALKPEEFQVLESRGRKRQEILKQIADKTFTSLYWDARLFGSTFLESDADKAESAKVDKKSKTEKTGNDDDKKKEFIRTGVAQFGMGVSICPVRIDRQTNTNKAGVEEGKDRGMAPLAYRIVPHGVYTMPYFVNAAAARQSGCTERDVELMKLLIPYAYSQTASAIRPQVILRHAWHMEHTSALGSCPDFMLLDALTPKRKDSSAVEQPSTSWNDYEVVPPLPEDLVRRLKSIKDLVLG